MMRTKTNVLRFLTPRKGWVGLFGLTAIEGLIAAVWLIAMPKDPGAGGLFGLSPARVTISGAILLAAGLSCLAGWLIGKRDTIWQKWEGLITSTKFSWVILTVSPILMIACVVLPKILYSLYKTSGVYAYLAYYERLLPVFIWLFLVGLQMVIGASMFGGKIKWRALLDYKKLIFIFAGIWLAFGIIFIFVALSGFGLVPNGMEWGLPTVPLMEWQIWLAWAVGSLFLCLLLVFNQSLRQVRLRRLDLFLGLLIWFVAVVTWLSQPMPFSYFAPTGRAPNYEIYPFSDAEVYGQYAQSLIVGQGFMGNDIPSRPLYITFLAGAIAIGGQEYSRIILFQTMGLAFLPVALYFLGKNLHSRPAGLVAAAMAILREVTSIRVTPFTDDISTSKILFADLPTALLLALFTLLVVKWLKEPESSKIYPILAGGALGMATLVRAQSIALLPVAMFFSLLVYWKKWSFWLKKCMLLALGMGLCISPWLVRNLVVTGRMVLTAQTGAVLATYESSRDHRVKTEMGGNVARYSQVESGEIMKIIRTNPGFVINFTAAHLINNEIGNLLVMPVRYNLADWKELVYPSEAFWQKWDGNFSPTQNALLLINLGIISLGIAACLYRFRLVGAFPLVVNLGYNLGTSLARFSGYRYLLPVDWAGYFYYAAGLITLSAGILVVSGKAFNNTKNKFNQPNEGQKYTFTKPKIWQNILAGLCILVVGGSPVLAENLVPERYKLETKEQLLETLISDPGLKNTGIDTTTLREFAMRENVTLIQGRGIYPRYYASGEGEPLTAKQGYEVQEMPRLMFLIVSQSSKRVILHLEKPPDYFPNASDVLLLGCKNGYNGFIVLVQGAKNEVYIDPDNLKDWSCDPQSD